MNTIAAVMLIISIYSPTGKLLKTEGIGYRVTMEQCGQLLRAFVPEVKASISNIEKESGILYGVKLECKYTKGSFKI